MPKPRPMSREEAKTAIQDAIKGGWKDDEDIRDRWVYDESGRPDHYLGDEIFLDPDFWRAYGKTKGWKEHNHPHTGRIINGQKIECCQCKAHDFLDHLFDGLSIDQALAEIK